MIFPSLHCSESQDENRTTTCEFHNPEFIICSSILSFYIPLIIIIFINVSIFKVWQQQSGRSKIGRKLFVLMTLFFLACRWFMIEIRRKRQKWKSKRMPKMNTIECVEDLLWLKEPFWSCQSQTACRLKRSLRSLRYATRVKLPLIILKLLDVYLQTKEESPNDAISLTNEVETQSPLAIDR